MTRGTAVGTKKTRGGEFVVREIVGITDRREESESVPMPVIDDGWAPWLPPYASVQEALKEEREPRPTNELLRRARAGETDLWAPPRPQPEGARRVDDH